MNEFRRAIVDKAFDRLDIDKSGELEASDIKGLYNPSRHPAVLEGRKTEDQVLQEFLETFEMHHNMRSGQAKDYKVNREEFREYYTNISANIDSDEYFETMMNNAWNLSGDAAAYRKQPKGWVSEAGRQEPVHRSAMESTDSPLSFDKKKRAPVAEDKTEEEFKQKPPMQAAGKATAESQPAEPEERKSSEEKAKFGNTVETDLPKYQNIMLERFRNKLVTRGAKGVIGLERQFKIFDLDGSGELSKDEFKKAVDDFKLGMDERDVDNLFRIFDKNMDGKISYLEFMTTVVGTMNEFRLNLVHNAFARLDANGDGVVDMEEIKKLYSAKHHPDVKCGKRTEEEVLSEFMSTFDINHSNSAVPDTKVTRDEFVAYYTKLSASIESDSFFDIMMTKAWGLGLDCSSDRLPYAGVATKIYQVDSKAVWTYDHHKTLYHAEHPLMPGDEEAESLHGEGKIAKSIYELSEVVKPGHNSAKKEKHPDSPQIKMEYESTY